jgi:hypothetical protein
MLDNLSDLVPALRVEAPGVPLNACLNALRNAVRTFCRDAEAWLVDLDPVDLAASEREYELEPDADAQVVRVAGLYLQTDEEATAGERGRLLDADTYEVRDGDPLSVFLTWTPAGTEGALLARVALMPNDGMPDDDLDLTFISRWQEAVVDAAAADLLAMPRRWRNLRRSAEKYTAYRTNVSRAKGELHRALQNREDVMGA